MLSDNISDLLESFFKNIYFSEIFNIIHTYQMLTVLKFKLKETNLSLSIIINLTLSIFKLWINIGCTFYITS